jgi:lysyl-tRNA synthetase class 2
MKDIIDPNILRFRHEAKKSIRKFLDDHGFLEIDTPYLLLSNTPDPFIDPINAESHIRKLQFQLHTSPEIWLKKVLSQGLDRIYHMGRVFRDDPKSPTHSLEFTMLEWYRAHEKLSDLIKDCQEIISLTFKAAREAQIIDQQPPEFIITDLDQLFFDQAKLDLSEILEETSKNSATYFQDLLKSRGEHLPQGATFCDAFFHIMVKYIEPNLPYDHPVVITRWPLQLAALAALESLILAQSERWRRA